MKTRIWCFAAAVAALAAVPSMARADNYNGNSTTSSTTTTTTTTTTGLPPIMLPNIQPAPTAPDGSPIDYHILTVQAFSGIDLAQAREDGFSNRDIRTMAKLAVLAHVPFSEIRQRVLEGATIPDLALQYGVFYADIQDSSDFQAGLADYELAYANTGEQAFENLVAGSQQEMVNGTVTSWNENEDESIAGMINTTPELSEFATAVHSAHMDRILRGPGALTVFAPTNAAFAKLSPDQMNALMNNPVELAKVIDYDIIPQRIDTADALAMPSPTSPATLEGDTLQVTSSNGAVYINGADVVKPDFFLNNGVVHEIDTVLIPPTVTDLAPASSTTTTTTSTTTYSNPVSTPAVTPPASEPPNMIAPAPAPAPAQ